MSGVITLYDHKGDYVKEKKFKIPSEMQRAISEWKKLYGKGFLKCKTKVEYDIDKQDPSPFKKGPAIKTFKVRKTNRSNFPNMDGH